MEESLLPVVIFGSVVPIILILSAGVNQQRILRSIVIRRKRGRRMSDEMMKSLIGKKCTFSTGPFGETFKNVEVLEVDNNWIRVKDGKRERLVNSEYVTTVKIVGDARDRKQ